MSAVVKSRNAPDGSSGSSTKPTVEIVVTVW
jgi:hypothetical protein